MASYSPSACKHFAALLGYLHDTGKSSLLWQQNLLKGLKLPPHSRTGMVLNERLWEQHFSDEKNVIPRDIVSYVIGAHHGLFDGMRPGWTKQGIDEKIKGELEDGRVEETLSRYEDVLGKDFLENLYVQGIQEALDGFFPKGEKISPFEEGFLARMWLSTLIDGDWSDAGAFSQGTEKVYQEIREGLSMEEMEKDFEWYIEKNFGRDTSISKLRWEISEECKNGASRPPGIYRLSVPTGSGKTMAAMRYALHHGRLYKKERIFYLAPYISILEQNAKVYREVLGNSREKEFGILEFHSSIVADLEDSGMSEGERDIYKYLGENFEAPLVLTTMVQFLEALFSGKKSAIRRLHRFQNSVVIVDEIQSVPLKTLSLLHEGMNILARRFQTTFLVCSATIPPIEGAEEGVKEGVIPLEYAKDAELTRRYDKEAPFDRVTLESLLSEGAYDEGRLVEKVLAVREEYPSILIIVNTRSAAKKIYEQLKKYDPGVPLYHLSNNMCPAHRLDTLERIRNHRIEDPHIIVSTNLIEAGVDLSVSAVVRSVSKWDSIIQAMGRCNRHHEFHKKGKVFVVLLTPELENTKALKEIHEAKDITQGKLWDYFKNPERYDYNFGGMEMARSYFRDYLKDFGHYSRYPYEVDRGRSNTLYDLLGRNLEGLRSYIEGTKKKPKRYLNQAFKTAGEYFQVIDNSGIGVVVPYEGGKDCINELLSQDVFPPEKYKVLRRAQRFTVTVYENILKKLVEEGMVHYEEELGVCILKEGCYDEDVGLNLVLPHFDDIIF